MTFAELSKKIATCYNSLPALVSTLRDGFANLEGGGSSDVEYSTTERKIGKWINGKPLYQKTAYISNITISADSATDLNISDYFSDIDSAVNFECCDENGGIIFPNVMVSSSLSPYSIGVSIDKGNEHITFTRGSGSSATINVYLTLWYTKTADTANS